MKRAGLILLLGACELGSNLPMRPQSTRPTSVPVGIVVAIAPEGGTGFGITASNERDVPIRLVWDESTFVDHSGLSYGRLLRGRTHIIDDTKPQLPSLIVPKSHISEFCVAEALPTALPVDINGKPILLEALSTGIGRMYIVFDVGGAAREVWEGELDFTRSTPAPATFRPPDARPPEVRKAHPITTPAPPVPEPQ